MIATVIKFVSLATLPLCVIWLISAPDFEPLVATLTAFLSALGAHATNQYHQDPRARQDLPPSSATTAVNPPVKETRAAPRYARTIGFRLKGLREQVLNLSLTEMAEFLGLGTVGTLERYEEGEDEYPLSLIKKIKSFFRVDEKYLELGSGQIFRPFVLSLESVAGFLRDGYSPILACCNDHREDLLCYLIFGERTARAP